MAAVLPTDRELEALKVLWEKGQATGRDIYLSMSSPDAELVYTRVLNLLHGMEEKGLVGRQLAIKMAVYYPRVRRDAVYRRLAGHFLDSVFDGSLIAYVQGALAFRRATPAELDQLEKIIIQARRSESTRAPKRQSP
jgi:predicted transcriptional regulator